MQKHGRLCNLVASVNPAVLPRTYRDLQKDSNKLELELSHFSARLHHEGASPEAAE